MTQNSSASLFSEARRYIPGGVNSPVRAFRNVGGEPFFVVKAKGSHLWDIDGREYIDFVGTWGPAILGHAPDVVVEAVQKAAANGLSFGIPNPSEVELARLICNWVPSVEKVRLVNSGTEATMSCIRLARGFTGRDLIIKFEGCYHGHVDSLLVKAGSGALTHGSPDSAGVPKELAALTIALPFNEPEKLSAVFAAEGDRIAGVIVEPVPGNAGLYLPLPGFLEQLRQLCSAHGSVGAFGGRAEIMDQLSPDGPVYQAGTLSGNPLAMAAGIAQLQELERTDGFNRLEKLGSEMEAAVRQTLIETGRNYTFHRIGSMFCLYFCEPPVHNLTDARRADLTAFKAFFHHCLSSGVYFAPSQFEAGFLCLAHTSADLDRTIEVVRNGLR